MHIIRVQLLLSSTIWSQIQHNLTSLEWAANLENWRKLQIMSIITTHALLTLFLWGVTAVTELCSHISCTPADTAKLAYGLNRQHPRSKVSGENQKFPMGISWCYGNHCWIVVVQVYSGLGGGTCSLRADFSFFLCFTRFRMKQARGGTQKSFGGGVLLGLWNPYPIPDHFQLHFATKF